jgi:hypothetical protein
MALDAAVPPPPQAPVVAAATVALEARRSAAAVRKRKNKTDLASTQVHVQRLREENRRPNTRSTYSKCWRLWRVNAGALPPPSWDGPPVGATLTALDRSGVPALVGPKHRRFDRIFWTERVLQRTVLAIVALANLLIIMSRICSCWDSARFGAIVRFLELLRAD